MYPNRIPRLPSSLTESKRGQRRHRSKVYWQKATRLQEYKIKSIQVEADQESAPITYVNTQFGDLRSVTSVLSEPVTDSSRTVSERNATDFCPIDDAERKSIQWCHSKRKRKTFLRKQPRI